MQPSDPSDADRATPINPQAGASSLGPAKHRKRNIKRSVIAAPFLDEEGLAPLPPAKIAEAGKGPRPIPEQHFENLDLYREDTTDPDTHAETRPQNAPAPGRPGPKGPGPRGPGQRLRDQRQPGPGPNKQGPAGGPNTGPGKGPGRPAQEPKVIYIPPPAVGAARPRSRHWGLLLSFFLVVLAPFAVAGWYLTERAVDQYASTMGFSVRKEDAGSSLGELPTSILSIGNQSSSDTDVIYEFIQSQDLVERVDAQLDLRSIYSKPDNDPVFSLDSSASIEELVEYWQRMITIFYDAGTGLMEIRILAFDPQDAQKVNQVVFTESSKMINALSAIARDDTTGYAREDLDRALDLLRKARVAITEFRLANNFVTPEERIQQDNTVLTYYNQQLAEAEIDQALTLENARAGDPRLRQGEQRIEVIRQRIAEEQAKFGTGDQAYANLVGEYESLVVDREFAESSYLAALTNFNAAVAEATRQSRYLAPHIRPTLAQTAEYPQRAILLGMLGLILLMSWAILSMLYYSIKDRR